MFYNGRKVTASNVVSPLKLVRSVPGKVSSVVVTQVPIPHCQKTAMMRGTRHRETFESAHT